jgi:hypothetical protein
MSDLRNKLFFNKYKLQKLIYTGKDSWVYQGINIKNKEPIAIKLENRNGNKHFLESEAFLLFNLKGLGIPKVISFGKTTQFKILIEELLGLSLNNLMANKKDKNNIIFYAEEELNSTRDDENRLISIEKDIFNFENNSENNKKKKSAEQETILHQINSTTSSFQAIKNNLNNNYIPFNQRSIFKKNSMSDNSSNITKSLTSKNIGNNKHYLPKIKAQKLRKDSNGSNNGNTNNIYTIKNSEILPNSTFKNGFKDKIIAKNKSKQVPCSQNRTPSAKICKGNYPMNNKNINININNNTYDELNLKNNYSRRSNKSISNKNINHFYLKPNTKTLNFQKDYNNTYIHGSLSSKIYINAEKPV